MGALKLVFISTLLLLISACGGSPVHTQHLHLQVTPDLNENRPVAVDLVVVYDVQLMQLLQKLSARQWNQRKQQFKRDYSQWLKLREWGLVPGESIPDLALAFAEAERIAGILLFADYATPGLHRMRLDPFNPVMVQLGKYDMQLYADY